MLYYSINNIQYTLRYQSTIQYDAASASGAPRGAGWVGELEVPRYESPKTDKRPEMCLFVFSTEGVRCLSSRLGMPRATRNRRWIPEARVAEARNAYSYGLQQGGRTKLSPPDGEGG